MLTESNVGRWDKFYIGATNPQAYGDSDSYRIGAEFLAGCDRVEDWGCGLGWFRQLIDADRYVGVDGSHSKFADVVADLETYRSDTSGLFMRHVLEHNYRWPLVLDNALASFTERMVLVIFTPWVEPAFTYHEELSFEKDYGVPTLAFRQEAIESRLSPHTFTCSTIESPQTFYGVEYIFLVEHS